MGHAHSSAMKGFDDVTKDALCAAFRSHFNSPSLDVTDLTPCARLSNTNDYFNSDVCRVTATVEFGKEGHQEVHLVLKQSLRESALHRAASKGVQMFLSETLLYTRAFVELGVAAPRLAEMTATCYYGYATSVEAMIDNPGCCETRCCFPFKHLSRKPELGLLVFEDLGRIPGRNFRCLKKIEVPSLEHVKLAFETLGHFNGIWYRYLKGDHILLPWKEDELDTQTMTHFTFSENGIIKPLMSVTTIKLIMRFIFKTPCQAVTKLLKHRGVDEEIVRRYKKYVNKRFITDLGNAWERVNVPSPFTTFTHGDFWTNNLMFDEDSSTGKPLSVKMLDFQNASHGVPFYDLIYYLHISTDAAFRAAHEEDLVRLHYNTFTTYAPPGTFPAFEEYYAEFKELGAVRLMAAMFGANMLSPNKKDPKEVAEVLSLEIGSPDKEDDHPEVRIIRQRLVDTIIQLDEKGIFGQKNDL